MNPSAVSHLRRLLAGLCLLIFFPALAMAGMPPSRVAILPFAAHSDRDLNYLTSGLRDMLASRLASQAGVEVVPREKVTQALAGKANPSDPAALRLLGANLQADYILAGSLTTAAGSLSLDATLTSVKGDAQPQTFYATAPREEEIISAIDNLSWQIAEKAFGKTKPAATSAAAGVAPIPIAGAQQAADPYQTAHPDRLLMGKEGGYSNVLRPLGVVTGALGFTKSQDLNYGLVAMDVGDVDGDGQDEFVLASAYDVRIYRRTDGRYQKIAQIPLGHRYTIHWISLGDINKNGRQEIYVSAADSSGPSSTVLEWDGKGFAHLADNLPWYLRVIDIPGQGKVLAGQQSGINQLFAKGVFKVSLQGDRVVKGEALQTGGTNLFDFSYADLEGNGSLLVVAISQDDRLMVIRPSGKVLWTSDDYFGGTTRFVGGQQYGDLSKIENDSNARIYIPARIIIRDVNNDGRADVIINKNLSSASRILARTRSYPNGEIHALTWNGISLTDLWQTRKIDGYISDYQMGPVQVVPTKDGKPQQIKTELNVGVVLNSSGFDLFKSDSAVLTFPLHLTGDEGKAQTE